MQQKEIRYYSASNGKAPFLEWLNEIKHRVTKARIQQRVNRLTLGLYGDCKTISKNLWELRLDFEAGYRIYFTEQKG
jgi:putative addiction module killer protein